MRPLRSHIALTALILVPAAFGMVRPEVPPEDKVRLISATSAQLIEKDGENYRKVTGPAIFRHNDTDLLCDSALWNVNTDIIDAMGNVRIIQERTKLSSATLQYKVDENMALFRGDLVQLEDEDGNILRTRYLDYNTKDSVAIFQNGAAMKDKDGQLIESIYGTYDAKAKLFVFNDRVNMYLDTTFVKTSRLEYRSDISTAYFGYATDMWQGKEMLSANDGRYDRNEELFFFRRNVHILTEEREGWSDSLYYRRGKGDVEMLGHVELMDTTRNAYALAGRLEYSDSLSSIRMTREPAVMSVSEEEGRRDTLYLGADVLLSRAIRRCDVPEAWVKDAETRLKSISGDPVMEYRKKAAEEAARAAEEAAKAAGTVPGRPPVNPPSKAPAPANKPVPDKQPVPDSLAVQAQADTLPPPPDTTKINFLWGSRRVKLFRRDMQMRSDSLDYSDLDSLVRLYKDPVLFNEGNRQYASDSIYAVIKDRQMQKAHLLSNAFITIEEAPGAYDQVRGAEMVAYFDTTTALTRFDALGGASSLFYLEENGTLATVNKVDTKMIYATFKDGEIERIYYYDNPKNDGYPTVQLPEEEKSLKGFRWEPEKRPASPLDVTSLVPRRSERTSYLARPHASFEQTEIYFPGHVSHLYREIAIRDSLKVVREREKAEEKPKEDKEEAKVPEKKADAPADSTARAETPVSPADSLSSAPAPSDSLAPVPEAPSAKEIRREERERKKALREAAKKARWAELDRQDSLKREAKALKKLEKERKRKLEVLKRLDKRSQKDRAIFEKYLLREQKKKKRKQ